MSKFPTAYAVLAIDKKTRQIKGVGVFGEPEPGFGDGVFTIPLFSRCADSYDEAAKYVLKALEMESYIWLRPVIEMGSG